MTKKKDVATIEADVDDLIRNCAIEANRIERERGELTKQMADIRSRLDEAGVQPRVFEYAVRIEKMEPEAQVEHTNQLELCFNALKIGQGASATESAKKAIDDLVAA